MDRLTIWLRRGLLLCVVVLMLTGVLAGLARLGVDVGPAGHHAAQHGPLMVLGVFGAVIALERAVALGSVWALSVPLIGVVGAGWMQGSIRTGALVEAVSVFGMVLVNAALVRRQTSAITGILLLGSVVLWVGTVLFALGQPVFAVVPTWIAFFVLTIVAERLELSRLAKTPRFAQTALLVLLTLVSACACAAPFWPDVFVRLLGVLLSLCGVWQLRFDIARTLVKKSALPRYAATGVLLGAMWLVVAGMFFASVPPQSNGPLYDAALHCVFVGYVLSMVFAHAPIIFPAVAQGSFPFSRALYVPLFLLSFGLVLRVLGDGFGVYELRSMGAVGSSIALPLFVLAALFGAVRKKLRREKTT
ncbi:MAG TPA: hypothetical protein PKE31_15180 [Pseudomonadota bacterium]|jgi:hypothetical protein|nr:hypothetical protein [Pseudomonadota bacterium]